MQKLNLSAEESFAATSVSNTFIDYYMPSASGSFVKVYLYLLRCMYQTPEAFSISYLADRLEETEKDITRALRYWEKLNLLQLQSEKNGTISGISLLTPERPASAESTASLLASPEVQMSTGDFLSGEFLTGDVKSTLPEKPEYSTEQIRVLSNDDEVKWIFTIIENYLSRPLKPKDVQLVLYLYDSLHFNAELIFYLYEHCISKGKKSASYIEAVALSWAEQGIQTVEEAENASIQYNSGYSAVTKAFGLNRMPGAAERRFIDSWITGYGFSIEIITEACNRTLLNTQKPDFKYADRILTNWHEKGVHSTADIKKLDSEFNASKAARLAAPEVQKKTPNRFNAFPQRNYSKEDYANIEKALLRKGYADAKESSVQ